MNLKRYNVPYVLLSVGMLWFGWFGFNAGNAIGIGRDVGAGSSATVAFVATTVAASVGGLAWALAEWFSKGKPIAVELVVASSLDWSALRQPQALLPQFRQS